MSVDITTVLFPIIIHLLTLLFSSVTSCWFVVHDVFTLPVCCLWLWPRAILWLRAWCLWLFLTGPQSSEADMNHLAVGEVSGCSLCAMTQPSNPGILSRLWLHMGKGISTNPKTYTQPHLDQCFYRCSRCFKWPYFECQVLCWNSRVSSNEVYFFTEMTWRNNSSTDWWQPVI